MNLRSIFSPFPHSINGKRPRAKRKKFRDFIIFICVFTIFILGCNYVEHHAMPIVIEMSSLKINTMATKIINQAVDETLSEAEITTKDLLSYYYNEEGEMLSCGVNTILINQICSSVIEKITTEVDVVAHEEILIPFGHIIGDGAFANYGPDIAVEILPYGTANINYDKEFVSTGINQVNYRVWLDIELTMQLILPLNREQVVVRQQVTLIDSVISGDVPDNYVNVPDENILDVTE